MVETLYAMGTLIGMGTILGVFLRHRSGKKVLHQAALDAQHKIQVMQWREARKAFDQKPYNYHAIQQADKAVTKVKEVEAKLKVAGCACVKCGEYVPWSVKTCIRCGVIHEEDTSHPVVAALVSAQETVWDSLKLVNPTLLGIFQDFERGNYEATDEKPAVAGSVHDQVVKKFGTTIAGMKKQLEEKDAELAAKDAELEKNREYLREMMYEEGYRRFTHQIPWSTYDRPTVHV